jgi:hypothetical protein
MSGYNQGQWIRLPANVGFDKDFNPRPTHTNDGYLDYYVGVHDWALAVDNYNNADGTRKRKLQFLQFIELLSC